MIERFRFQGLEIWKKGIEIGEILFSIADQLEECKLFRFAEQLRGQDFRFQTILQKVQEVSLARILPIS
jgi:hypothetical protein